jgi:spermidine synthase
VYAPETVRKNADNLRRVFKQVHPMTLFIPLYGSLWCLGVASDSANPRLMTADAVATRLRERRIAGLKYYNPEVHGALFALPNFVKALTDRAQEPARLAA